MNPARPVPHVIRCSRPLGGLLLVALALLAGCGSKSAPALPTVITPKFSDFTFPAVPEGIGSDTLADRHRAAWQYLQAGDLRAADRAFTAILKEAPAFYPSETALGYVAAARKDLPAAVAHFDRALSRNSSYAPALTGKGEAMLALGRTDAALAAFEAALVADPALPALAARVDALRFRNMQQEIDAARKASDAGQLVQARTQYEAAIAGSPQSSFLYRELAGVERRAGDLLPALMHAEQAAQMDPGDARALTLIGEIHEANREWSKAADDYTAASALEPAGDLSARADAMREKAAFDAMPEEYRAIETAPSISRAQLAALIAVRLEDLLRRARARNAVVVTDTRDSWAAPWILAVTRAGVMEVYPNHTFQPRAPVRRGDLAQAVSRILALIGVDKPKMAANWHSARPRFADVGPGHFSYPAAALAVSAGVMTPGDGGTFQLTRPVSGAEAVAAVTKLGELAKGGAR